MDEDVLTGKGEEGSSSSALLMRESTDCEDATRILGGAVKRNGGDGEFGWLSGRAASTGGQSRAADVVQGSRELT